MAAIDVKDASDWCFLNSEQFKKVEERRTSHDSGSQNWDPEIELLLGEKRVLQLPCHLHRARQGVPGVLCLTNFKCVFIANPDSRLLSDIGDRQDSSEPFPLSCDGNARGCCSSSDGVVSLPLGCIGRADAYAPSNNYGYGYSGALSLVGMAPQERASSALSVLPYAEIASKHSSVLLRVAFSSAAELTEALRHIRAYAGHHPLTELFVHTTREAFRAAPVLDMVREVFERQGAPQDKWRVSDVNKEYAICSTYPKLLVVPSRVQDATLRASANYRSRGRIPLLTYYHRPTRAALVRCSQPQCGISGARCIQDEELLLESAPDNPVPNDAGISTQAVAALQVFDARSATAGVGNTAIGGGYESSRNYRLYRFTFLGLDNIHTLALSHKELLELNTSGDDTAWLKRLEVTRWLDHVQILLSKSVEVAECIGKQGMTAVIHCSDGWDRTPALCATAQIILDPFFRTIQGLQVLIEKDWLAMGHRFAHRCGHPYMHAPDDQRSPVFLLWLDCVWQLQQQFEQAFEYDSRLLVFIAHHAYACRFRTFLFDTDKERQEKAAQEMWRVGEEGGRLRVACMWSYIQQNIDRFRNPCHRPHPAPLTDLHVRPCNMKFFLDLHQPADAPRSSVWTMHEYAAARDAELAQKNAELEQKRREARQWEVRSKELELERAQLQERNQELGRRIQAVQDELATHRDTCSIPEVHLHEHAPLTNLLRPDHVTLTHDLQQRRSPSSLSNTSRLVPQHTTHTHPHAHAHAPTHPFSVRGYG